MGSIALLTVLTVGLWALVMGRCAEAEVAVATPVERGKPQGHPLPLAGPDAGREEGWFDFGATAEPVVIEDFDPDTEALRIEVPASHAGTPPEFRARRGDTEVVVAGEVVAILRGISVKTARSAEITLVPND